MHYSGLAVLDFGFEGFESLSVVLDFGFEGLESLSVVLDFGFEGLESLSVVRCFGLEDVESDFVEPQLQLSFHGCPAGMGSETPPATP